VNNTPKRDTSYRGIKRAYYNVLKVNKELSVLDCRLLNKVAGIMAKDWRKYVQKTGYDVADKTIRLRLGRSFRYMNKSNDSLTVNQLKKFHAYLMEVYKSDPSIWKAWKEVADDIKRLIGARKIYRLNGEVRERDCKMVKLYEAKDFRKILESIADIIDEQINPSRPNPRYKNRTFELVAIVFDLIVVVGRKPTANMIKSLINKPLPLSVRSQA